MSKISQYLNEHILGEVMCAESVRKQFSTDGSILTVTPDLIVNPRATEDIRKIARFTWQLAEKGHVMPITIRGGGTDQTGAAVNNGIIINSLAHLNKIIYLNLKDKDQFVHTQPGVTFGNLNEALRTHGITIPTSPTSSAYSTIGGAVANNSAGPLSGQYGKTGDFVTRLEVVLANGDIIETGRISKHELNNKKGLQTLEGEIYRKIDAIIEDNEQIINDKISNRINDNSGYPGIAKVREKDGSFDLTPLFIGSQGTLGIISELVAKTIFVNFEESILVATFDNPEVARDTADALIPLKPVILQLTDCELYDIARTHGKKFIFDNNEDTAKASSVLYICFNDFSNKARNHKLKKTVKILSKVDSKIFTSDEYSVEDLHAILEVSSSVILSDNKEESYPQLIDGLSIPADRREEFIVALSDLSAKHHIKLPLQINWLNGVIHARTALNLHTISDKQKTFKLISDCAEIVYKFGGSFCYESAEGRLKSLAAYSQFDDSINEIYNQIRLVFNPFGTLNPGVKQLNDVKTLVSILHPSSDLSLFSKYSPRN